MRLYPFPVVRSGIFGNCVLHVYVDAQDTFTLHYTIVALGFSRNAQSRFLVVVIHRDTMELKDGF